LSGRINQLLPRRQPSIIGCLAGLYLGAVGLGGCRVADGPDFASWFRGLARLDSVSSAEIGVLILRARNGCSDSLGRLLEMYRNYLQMITNLQIDGAFRQKFSPSDVVQETFLQAHRHFGEFQGGGEPELLGWLRKILASQLAMKIRHHRTVGRDLYRERQLEIGIEESAVTLSEMLSHHKSPSSSAIRRERAVLLADALAHLSDDQRQVIVLRHLRGHSLVDVAQQTERNYESVKKLWQRGIKRMQELLEDQV